MDIRTGYGYDVHALEAGNELVLGGVRLDYPRGLKGHSDADVLLHAIMDALLGAAGLGDIGRMFPDTDSSYKGADSRRLLREVHSMVAERNFTINNVDATLIAEAPKIQPYVKQMVTHVAEDLKLETSRISIKATTSESLGFIGREEGMAAMAVATLVKKENGS